MTRNQSRQAASVFKQKLNQSKPSLVCKSRVSNIIKSTDPNESPTHDKHTKIHRKNAVFPRNIRNERTFQYVSYIDIKNKDTETESSRIET